MEVKLIASKTKVAPLKKQSIPRLELLGATILVRLAATVRKALPAIRKQDTLHWVDSMAVLCWIRNSKPWKQYVMSRVVEIRESTTAESWKFCPGERNPADIPSRGMKASDLAQETRWWNGPEFLYKPESEWPRECNARNEPEFAMKEIVKNPKSIVHALTNNIQEKPIDLRETIDVKRYSTMRRLLKVTGYVLRFKQGMTKKLKEKMSLVLSAEEINKAEELWIKCLQNESFTEEVSYLKSTRKSSIPILVQQFEIFLDERGILRCQGRIQNSSLNQEGKTPILLPSNDYVTALNIEDIHNRVMHSGVSTTLTAIRERFWILRGQIVKKILRRCVKCKKLEGRPFNVPRTPDLPEARVSDDPHFSHLGVDFVGPLYTAEKSSTNEGNKAYVCLFTCASTNRLSAGSFLMAFRRFASRRGLPVTLMSDNAKTFKAASKDVAKLARSKEVLQYLANNGVTWKFIIEKAAWWGGFWERMVQTVKRTLRKVIGRSCLSFEELSTLLTEVEGIVNARPLTYVHDDQDGISFALSPSQLINGRRIQPTPNSSHFEIISTNESLTRRVKHQRRLLNQFTATWRRDYLFNLRESHAAITSKKRENPNIAVGDVA